MKRVLQIALITLIVSFVWRDVMVFGIFKYQQDQIAQSHCIQRNVKESSCHGSCVLNERLSQPISSSPASQPEPILVQVKMEFLVEDTKEIILHPSDNHKHSYFLEQAELDGHGLDQIKPPPFV